MTYRGVTLINFPDVPVTASFSPLMVKEWTSKHGAGAGALSAFWHSPLIDLCRADFQNPPNECERTTLNAQKESYPGRLRGPPY